MIRTILFLVALLFANVVAVVAQDDDVIRTNTDLVVLNVTVTDKAGQYVKSLKASDFKVYEDGVEVQTNMIADFSVQEAPYAAVVLLDSSGSMEARFSLARSAAIRFLDGLRPEDVAAVYRFDSKVERVQEFSGGRDLAPIAYAIHAKGMTTLNDAIVEAAKLVRDELRLLVENQVRSRQAFDLGRDLIAKLVHARLVVAAQRRPEIVAPDVDRCEMKAFVAHACRAPNRIVPSLTIVAPSSTAIS